MGVIKVFGDWKTNGELIADCARLGYLRDDWVTLDPTYGHGTFWTEWRPKKLIACDKNLLKSPLGQSIDFRSLPWADRHFDAVVFDPPYKLNGTATEEIDARYGVEEPATWQERHALIRAGLNECARVLGDGFLLLKCQAQVSRNQKRWQDFEFTLHLMRLGIDLVDRFEFPSYRAQPEGRPQVHAHTCSSQLLVFRRDWWTSDLSREELGAPEPAAAKDSAQAGLFDA